MSSIDGEVPSHVPYTEYNKNASPFYPNSNNYSYLIKFSNLPLEVNESHLTNLIDSIIMTNFEDRDTLSADFSIVDFHNDKGKSGTANFAIIEILQWEFGTRLIELLNGHEWLLKQLEAKLISNDDGSGQGYGSHDTNFSYYGSYYPSFPMAPLAPMNYNYIHSPNQASPAFHIPQAGAYSNSYISRRSSKSSVSRRNSRSSNASSKPLPSFITNLVNENVSDSDDNKSDIVSEGNLPVTNEFIIVKNDEGQSIKVNPCRLFIGNIPFSSTWTTLKNFLVLKSEEIEPGNHIKILRVEIPMQLLSTQHNSNSASNSGINVNLNKLNNYQFLSSFITTNMDNSSGGRIDENTQATRGLSRGFAIVTTGNKESLDKLIKYFDNVEFENRSLTVRYDKFPDFNNYILQQINPDSNRGNAKLLPISNLAFERNQFQQKFYYGNSSYPPMMNGYFPYPIYYNNPIYYPPMNYGPISGMPPMAQQYPPNYTISPLNEYKNVHAPKYPPSHNSDHEIPRNKEGSALPTSSNTHNRRMQLRDTTQLTDDEKARELVESFQSLDISST